MEIEQRVMSQGTNVGAYVVAQNREQHSLYNEICTQAFCIYIVFRLAFLLCGKVLGITSLVLH